ncbi:hypothetical protein [Parabacteroides johnsonii]
MQKGEIERLREENANMSYKHRKYDYIIQITAFNGKEGRTKYSFV